MKRQTFGFRSLIGIAFLFFILGMTGCGEKGPPLPVVDTAQRIMEPYDLKIDHSDSVLSLSWSHRIDPVDAWVKPERFDVFMSVKGPSDCEDCPFQFKTVGTVPMPQKEFITRVEKGYDYYFRVQAVGEENVRSEYSKTIRFEAR